jgi:Tfp pilus assembly protein PilZ
MWGGMNKRKFPRANYNCEIFIKKSFFSKKIKAHTENIGVGGICVVLNSRLSAFQDVNLTLILGSGSEPITCRGKVMWEVKKDLPYKKALYDTGIEFVSLENGDRSRIEEIVESLGESQVNVQKS